MYTVAVHFPLSLCAIFDIWWGKQRDCFLEQKNTANINPEIVKNSQDKPELSSKWAFYLKAHVLELSTFSRKTALQLCLLYKKKQHNTKILILNFNTIVVVSVFECILQM